MTTRHPDSAAIDRLGINRLTEHFGVTDRTVRYWRARGVPAAYRLDIVSLAKRNGIEVPEIKKKRDLRQGRPRMPGTAPASSATPT